MQGCVDSRQIVRLVQRGQRLEIMQMLVAGRVDEQRLGVIGTAMHHR